MNDATHPTAPRQAADNARSPIGRVLETSGSAALIALDPARLDACSRDGDPCIARAGRVGSQVKLKVGAFWVLCNIREQRHRGAEATAILAQVDFLGEGKIDPDRGAGRADTPTLVAFRRGVTHYPVPGFAVYAASTADLRQVYTRDGRANIAIGTVYPTGDIRAGLYIDAFLGRHFALLGSTGTGKSTTLALILHQICAHAPRGHVVVIDPHGEYGRAFRDRGVALDAGNLVMPYWLMNFEEHCEALLTSQGPDRQIEADILAKCLYRARGNNKLAKDGGRFTVDSPTPYLLSDLLAAIQHEMGQLDKAYSTAPYLRLKNRIEELRGDPRYRFMFSGMLVADSFGDFLAQVFRLPGEGRPISVIDLSGVPSAITATVVAVLGRLLFDYATWSRAEEMRPILLVCEEAHRYVPNERNVDGSSVGRTLSRIAKEGRKYGVSLGLVTQRPSDLAEGVLSQCGTIIAMRLNNERDRAVVAAAMPEGGRGFLDSITALRNREAIVCGEGVSIPMRMSFDTLDEAMRPASADPSFAMLWGRGDADRDAVDRVVARWRSHS